MIALFAEAPALPLHTAGPYVAAAYIVFLLVVLIYVWIMARKLMRNSRELQELRAQLEERRPPGTGPAGPAPVDESGATEAGPAGPASLEPAAHD
jgi:HAMP domain-containing protein